MPPAVTPLLLSGLVNGKPQKTMTQRLIIFDLDGTLADTAPDLISTLNRITAPFDLAPTKQLNFGNLIGQGARAMIQRAFELNNIALDEPLLDDLFEQFLVDYAANIAVETRLFDGAIEVIAQLEQSGDLLAVCTNKTEFLARRLLDQLGISQYFASVTGGNSFAFRKPDGRHILETIKLAGGDKTSSIMIGDSNADIQAAKNAGIPSIAVTFGYSDQPAESLGADAIVSTYSELTIALDKLSASKPGG